MDPYVQFSHGGVTVKTRPHNSGGKSPSWSETLSMDVRAEDFVQMTVWD